MEHKAVATRKGKTKIQAKLHSKYKIDTEKGISIKPKKSTVDLAGSGSSYASPKEMKNLLDKLRDEDVLSLDPKKKRDPQ